ncbi:hypothetical protein J416_09404 [Gracilibacillus halophilus YIM-C55.5]|uniref:Uncharacterized protein n=1 Tax=Gracilibacillus halophilus YIM-C55.5 TaxID=1308866 RepID=N4W8S7_9BACI|nr:hypothetical protein [Gracilibacillus halophilus]ENH96703.1 hypothetical protein J416_09404 [Gracilibacillus halophilus YIM-C55.5]
MNVNFKGYDCIAAFGKYLNGNTAIQLVDAEDDSLVAVATVNGEIKNTEEIVGIKNWSENEGMVDALIDAGVIEPDLKFFEPSAFVVIEYYKLTDAAYQELQTFMGAK